MRRKFLAVLGLVAACSSSSKPAVPSSSSGPLQVTIRVEVQAVGFGCTGNNVVGGRGHKLTAKDGTGNVVGVSAPFDLTPGHDSCDFTTILDVQEQPTFLVLESETGTKLVTLPAADYTDGTVTLHVDSGGSVTGG